MPTPRHIPKMLMDVNAFMLVRGLCIVVSFSPFLLDGDPICPQASWKLDANRPHNWTPT